MALKSIDNIIDNDIKNDIMSFNPEANEQLRIKLLNQRVAFIPARDEKFGRLIDDFVLNKENLMEIKKQNEEFKEMSVVEEDEEDNLFKREREFVRGITDRR